MHVLTEIEDEQEPNNHSIDKNADKDVGGAEEEHRNAADQLAALTCGPIPWEVMLMLCNEWKGRTRRKSRASQRY